jgi:hypothetical protein
MLGLTIDILRFFTFSPRRLRNRPGRLAIARPVSRTKRPSPASGAKALGPFFQTKREIDRTPASSPTARAGRRGAVVEQRRQPGVIRETGKKGLGMTIGSGNDLSRGQTEPDVANLPSTVFRERTIKNSLCIGSESHILFIARNRPMALPSNRSATASHAIVPVVSHKPPPCFPPEAEARPSIHAEESSRGQATGPQEEPQFPSIR